MSLKILHINTELAWRGGERQIDLLIRHATEVQHLIACHPEGALYHRLKHQFPVIELVLSNGMDLRAAQAIAHICQNHAVDIIHCHTPKAQSVVVISRLLGNRTPMVVTKRTSFPVKNNYFSRYKYRKTHQVVCVSETSADALRNQIPELNIRIIPSAIEQVSQVESGVIEKKFPETKGRLKVGYVAALTEEKNPLAFVETARKLQQTLPKVIFLWVGEGKLRPVVEAQIAKYNLTANILLTGFQKDIHSWIADLDLLFFPSLSEGYPTTLLDAMQFDVPIIASDIAGIREIIQHQENGWLCQPHDSTCFTSGIEKILSDAAWRQTITTCARTSLKGRHAEDMARAYVGVYRHVLQLPA